MSVFEKRYQNLNERQKEAVDAIEGPVMVIAGPGSGKTELLSLRVANILRNTDSSPSDILCLTFTDAAARNMRERLAGLIGKDAYKVAIHTFHSFGSEIINHHPEDFYQGATYAPVDEISKIAIVEDIIKKLQWNSRLKSYHPEQGYTYLSAVISRIDEIKKGGLSPDEFMNLILENQDFEKKSAAMIEKVFAARISAGTIDEISGLISDLGSIDVQKREKTTDNYKTLKEVVVESLQRAVLLSESEDEKRSKTKPITEWKKDFLKKDSVGNWRLKTSFVSSDLQDLARVYEEYQVRMHKEGFYDFADMILDAVKELENNSELRFEIQEKFLYVLVDEFQDTSGVQMRFLDTIINTSINDGSPNILVVGDDDQSIYKFQGANLDNLNGFLKRYKGVKKIVLTQNYRSTQEILDYSQSIIEKADDRLASRDSAIVKELVASNPKIKSGKISQREFETITEEYIFVASEIQRIRSEKSSEEIAIISRKHGDLESVAAILNFYKIPFSYERNKNILEEKHIVEILTIAKFVNSLNQKREKEADEYLPDILTFPFLGIDRIDIWKISNLAHKSRSKNWLEIMLEFGGKPKLVAEFLIALGAEAKNVTLEEILDFITGTEQIKNVEYVSEFKQYYFPKEKFDNNRMEYLDCLFDLQTLFSELRKFRSHEVLYVKDLVEFLTLHETHNLSIYRSRHLASGKNPISLLTAHKAKGLEFDSVFIINCNENTWMKSRNRGKLSFPPNIPLTAEEDSVNDKTRLFFVAVTRAKSSLYLTNYCMEKEGDRETERLRFMDQDLSTDEIEATQVEHIKTAQDLLFFKEDLRHYKTQNVDEEELLKSLLEDYKLSVTHLHNFLDVRSGGPAKFLEQNLLHFPEAKSISGIYGTAVHESFNEFYKRFKLKGVLPSLEDFLCIFESQLKFQELNEKDFAETLRRGRDELSLYYEENKDFFNETDLLEIDFKNEGVMVGECPITGKIDRIVSKDSEDNIFSVYDYKTGKPFNSWSPADDFLKVKAHRYKDQLVFYKILIEGSRNFGKSKVVSGGIDFITSDSGRCVKLDMNISSEDVNRMERLIQAVYKKIIALDFPSVDSYPADFDGITAFEKDLLEGNI